MKELALAFVLALAQVAHGQISVRDDYGRTVTLPRAAERVVSLAPHLTELLYAAGAGARVAGAIESSDFPPEARALPRVGSEAGISLEALLALKPDLVAAWPTSGSLRQIDRIAELGIPVYRSEPRELDDVARTLLALGELTGSRAIAAQAARDFRVRAAQLERDHARRPAVRIFYQVWDRPIVTVNGEHLITKVMRLCGGVNVFAELPVLAPAVDREAVLRADPEVIVASGADESRPGWLEDWKAYPQLAAVARGNLYWIPPALIQRHTPRILEGAKRLCALLEAARSKR